MKTDFSYLPAHKQRELDCIVATIKEMAPAEMIILFGSYARNDWVEDKYDDEHYRYQSDMDILVIVETKSETAQTNYENEIESQISNNDAIKTPVSVIVHDIEFINRRLRKAQYFFKDITHKDGVLLYDSGKHQLAEPKELLPQERKYLAQEYFDYHFKEADDFKEGVDFYFDKEKLNKAVFLLHQTAERLYTAILLVFTHYKPNTHDLAILRKLTNSLSNDLLDIFPLAGSENIHLFKLLRKAYVDARYKPTYKITKEELQQLIEKVDTLNEIGRRICLQKIDSFIVDE
ncbi:MAG: HEPN domain-containing protein [Pseudomonadota bacterium]